MLTKRMVLFWGHFDSIFKSSVRKKKIQHISVGKDFES